MASKLASWPSLNKASIINFSFLGSVEVAQIYLSGWVGWGGYTLYSDDRASLSSTWLVLNLATGTEHGNTCPGGWVGGWLDLSVILIRIVAKRDKLHHQNKCHKQIWPCKLIKVSRNLGLARFNLPWCWCNSAPACSVVASSQKVRKILLTTQCSVLCLSPLMFDVRVGGGQPTRLSFIFISFWHAWVDILFIAKPRPNQLDWVYIIVTLTLPHNSSTT